MSARRKKWDEADDLYQAYVPESDADAKRRTRLEQLGEQSYKTISIPYSYATLLTAHTYWASVFLGRTPIYQYTGRHGEAQQKVQCLEALMDYQVSVGQMLPVLYLWLLDAGKYGVGIAGHYWDEERTVVSSYEEVQSTFLGVPIPGKKEKQQIEKEVRGYCGNRLYNVRPHDFYPDPNVTLANFQQGEFCGRVTTSGWNALIRGEQQGVYFNVKQAMKISSRGGMTGGEVNIEAGSPRIDQPAETLEETLGFDEGRTKACTLLEQVEELIPAEWGLGPSKVPQKWVFTIANSAAIIKAQPLGCLHNKFPWNVMSYEVAGYGHTGRGMLEVLKPLNETLDWLLNSHFFNVRQVLNDKFIVDPSRVIMKDLREGGPGKLVRLSPQAYGTDPRTVLTQLQTIDITQMNLRDVAVVVEMMQRATGVTDNLQGLAKTGGRRSATESRITSSFGVNRLKTFAEYNSALGFAPLSQALVQNTQQYYDQERQFKIAGDLLLGAPKFQMVTQDDIQGFFDFVPVDGTLPIDRFAQANLWKEILMGLMQAPPIMAQYDIGGIFGWMAQLAGLKNITQFKLDIQPDAALAAAAQAGNVVPMRRPGGPGQTPEIAGALQQ